MTDLRHTYARVLDYVSETLPEDPVHRWVLDETERRGLPNIQITPEQGRLLNLLAQLLGAKVIVEVGTLTGYSGIWLARALPPDGMLVTLECNPEHASLARDAFARAGVADRVLLLEGPAAETLATLTLEAPPDMLFVDADKANNRTYFDWGWQNVRPGGLIVVDNVLANGRVAEPTNGDAYARTIAAFNRYVTETYGDLVTIIPGYKRDEDNLDGTLIVRLPLEEN
jgi:predicted O-methyltransferase YrrM